MSKTDLPTRVFVKTVGKHEGQPSELIISEDPKLLAPGYDTTTEVGEYRLERILMVTNTTTVEGDK